MKEHLVLFRIAPLLSAFLLSTGPLSTAAPTPSGSLVGVVRTTDGLALPGVAVTLAGKDRLVARLPGFVGLGDVARDGRVLILDDSGRQFAFDRLERRL